MIGEVISIGDELTTGQRLDTNSQWLSQQLGELGIHVLYHTTVADELSANERVFRQAIARSDLVIVTGGLGPTADDLTREALARTLGVELVLDEPSLEHIRQRFARQQREMPERNRLQALFPAGSQPIFNPNGTAPGIALESPRPDGSACRLFALPGVPAEMFEMFRQSVVPVILAAGDRPQRIRHRRIKCFGVGESHIEQMLPDLIRRGRDPSVGITVHEGTITLRVTARRATPEACDAAMEPTIATIRACLGSLAFGEEDDELQDAVVRLLADRQRTLASLEWGTNGLLSHWLCEAASGRPHYRGGLVITSRESLGIGSSLAAGDDSLPDRGDRRRALAGLVDEHGANSGQLAAAMADACRRHFGTDYGLAVSSLSEIPDGAEGGQPDRFFYALATSDDVLTRSATLVSHPSIWKPRAAKMALNLLRLTMLEQSAGGSSADEIVR